MVIKRAFKTAVAVLALSLLISGCSIEFIEKSFDDYDDHTYSSVSKSEPSRPTKGTNAPKESPTSPLRR